MNKVKPAHEPERSGIAPLLARCAAALRRLALFDLRRAAAAMPTDEALDSRTGLLQPSALSEWGDPLLRKAQARSEPLSLLLFDFQDLVDVEALYGTATRRRLLSVIGARLRRLAGGKGLAVRLDATRFVVLLPGRCRDRAVDRVVSRLGKPCSFELDDAHEEVVVIPSLSIVCTTAGTGSVAQLLEQCRRGGAARRVETFRPQGGLASAPLGRA